MCFQGMEKIGSKVPKLAWSGPHRTGLDQWCTGRGPWVLDVLLGLGIFIIKITRSLLFMVRCAVRPSPTTNLPRAPARQRLADVAHGPEAHQIGEVPCSEGKCPFRSQTRGTWTCSAGALDRSGALADNLDLLFLKGRRQRLLGLFGLYKQPLGASIQYRSIPRDSQHFNTLLQLNRAILVGSEHRLSVVLHTLCFVCLCFSCLCWVVGFDLLCLYPLPPLLWFVTLIFCKANVSAINPNWRFWWFNEKTNKCANKFAPSICSECTWNKGVTTTVEKSNRKFQGQRKRIRGTLEETPRDRRIQFYVYLESQDLILP
jgi:hypothetical protein